MYPGNINSTKHMLRPRKCFHRLLDKEEEAVTGTNGTTPTDFLRNTYSGFIRISSEVQMFLIGC